MAIKQPLGLKEYIDRAGAFLPENDCNTAQEFLNAKEWALAVEHIADRLLDLDIQVAKDFAVETLLWLSKFNSQERQRRIRELANL